MCRVSVSWFEDNEWKEIVYDDQKVFSAKFKELRKSKSLSINDLSDILLINAQLIASWEVDHVPSIRLLERVCTYFGVSKGYFLSSQESVQLSLF